MMRSCINFACPVGVLFQRSISLKSSFRRLKVVGSVVKALGIEADVRSLHKLRIAVKRLRYAADLLLPVLQRQQVRDMAKALARLQKQLGAMQDHVVAKQELKRSIKGLRRRSHRKLLRDLIESETRSIAEGVAKFHAWLDSDACRDLKQCIEALA